jgi:HAE1 family hydrophobic/amphiphilic exporter-1
MRAIARFAVNNPVSVLMIILAVILMGTISFSRLGTDLFPDLNNPRIYIQLTAGERAPEEMESRFVEQVEALSIRQKGAVSVKSEVSVGTATVTVEYSYGQNMDEALLELQKALTQIQQDSEVTKLSLSRFDPNASPIMLVALVSSDNKSMSDLRKVAEKYIVNELVRLEGIADVKITGDRLPEVVVETQYERLKVNGLSSSDLVNAINSYNRNVSGGYIEEAGQKYIIKGISLFRSPNDLLDLVVGYRSQYAGTTAMATSASGGSRVPVLLRDVATVSMDYSKPANIVRINGKDCLGISIYKETRFNTVSAVDKLEEAFKDIENRLPGYQMIVVNNQGSIVTNAVNEVEDSALMGIFLAVIVLFVFLRRVGITLVVSLAIPISVIATFNLMYFNGLTLNVMTLGGLALGAGMLVDNAIVAIENIYRFIEDGKSVREAAIEGIAGVGGAIVASTLTTIVVFLPVVYLQGASGELFKDQAWTVAFSLTSSIFVAILMIPMMVSIFFKPRKSNDNNGPKGVQVSNWYGRFLTSVLEKRKMILIGSVVITLISAYLLKFIGSEFMPNYQSKELTLDVSLPAGTSLERTTRVMSEMEGLIRQISGDNLEWIYSHAGPDDSDNAAQSHSQGDHTGYLRLQFSNQAGFDINVMVKKLEELFKGIEGLEVGYVRGGSALTDVLGTDDAPFEVQISGSELNQLMILTSEVKSRVEANPVIMLTNVSFENGAPEVNVRIDRYRAGIFNLDVNTIMQQLKDFLQGKDAGKMDIKGDLIDIKLKMPEATIADLKQFKIKSGSNEYLLSEVAEITLGRSPSEISRLNQVRVGKVQGFIAGDQSFDKVVETVTRDLSTVELPEGYHIRIAGEEGKRQESFSSLGFALILSIVLVYMVMASQFESLVHPFTILLSIPLAGVGVVITFLVAGQNFNIMALIGVVMLGGIAVNNSILLVDAINRNKWEGYDLKSAIIKAGQQRIRPILMTSATTVLALLPLTIGFGESASLRAPMALAVIGGLTSSTLLTLVVIPCLYYVFDRKKPVTL